MSNRYTPVLYRPLLPQCILCCAPLHGQESKKAAHEKAERMIAQLREMKLKEAAKKVQDGVEETLIYCDAH